jgi:hypothetical protein
VLQAEGRGGEAAVNAVSGIAPAKFVDRVLADWSATGALPGRAPFGDYLIDRLERAGYTLRASCLDFTPPEPSRAPADVFTIDGEPLPAPTQVKPADLYPLSVPVPDLPHWNVAVGMSVGEVADLLEALEERGLRWRPGTLGGAGFDDGPAEPANLHVVFDEFRGVWQRDDDEAGPDPARWYSAASAEAMTWSALWRQRGPITPDGGIAPPDHVDAEPTR